MIRLLVCDDSDGARAALRAMLEEQGEIDVVGEAANGVEAVELATSLRPDVVLMDVAMPLLDGIGATQRIRRILPAVRIVAFTGVSESDVVEAMLEAGADAYCVKGAPLWELERALAGASDPLLRLAHTLARSTAGGVGAIVARELHELTGGAVAAVYIAEPGTGLSLAGVSGGDAWAWSSPPNAAVRAFAESAPVAADTGASFELSAAGTAFGDAFAVPLVSDGEPLGAVVVAMPDTLPFMIDVELVAAVADLAAAAIRGDRLLLRTRTEARRDALTGLPNRRAFDEALEELTQSGESFGLVLLDLDDFKHVNDHLGHQAGDDVLQQFARVALRTLRADEELYRVGGDEFALVVPGGDAVPPVIDRVLQTVRAHQRPRPLPAVSIGTATFPSDGRSAEELLARADAALYAFKAVGKVQLAPIARSSTSVLVVDDDLGLRGLLRTTLEAIDVEVLEAATAAQARRMIDAQRPDLVVLDVGLPGEDGLALCRELKTSAGTRDIPIAILTGDELGTSESAQAATADGFLRKPFSPLELLSLAQRLLGQADSNLTGRGDVATGEQVQLYANDLRRLLEIERGQRALLQHAYRQTVGALAAALESKDIGTGTHSQRVLRYATELAQAVDPSLLKEPGVEYGFLLHDVGKIGIPDDILKKAGELTPSERRVLETHTLLGEQMLSGVTLLAGGGVQIVRSHHERWDGRGYPDGLRGPEIPLGARVFAVADALDAITSDRPYRRPRSWDAAVAEVLAQSSRQFDPRVVETFREQEPALRRIYYEVARA